MAIHGPSENVSVEDLSQTDGIIIVIGITGSGKSTFVEHAAGSATDSKYIGHGLRSCTGDIRAIRVKNPSTDRDVVLVDTPGFDDTSRTDHQILSQIGAWLQETYQRKIKLAGIIYLHRICDNRMTESKLVNFNMLVNLCGVAAAPNVVLVSTQWSCVGIEARATQREAELRQKYWREMLDGGATYMRFEDTSCSAWAVANILLQKPPIESLEMQREMADRKTATRTKAGKAVTREKSSIKHILVGLIRRLFSW